MDSLVRGSASSSLRDSGEFTHLLIPLSGLKLASVKGI